MDNLMDRKDKGSFYTPIDVATWMAKVSLSTFDNKNFVKKNIHILEPSCGDGVFIKAIQSLPLDPKKHKLIAVELDTEALLSAKQNQPNHSYINCDFLTWVSPKKFDLIIGNPPYIVKKRLSIDQANSCKEIHKSVGLRDREVANIWTSFVIKSTKMLSKNGVLSFVLPNELLQVNYTKEIRNYLLSEFDRVEIVSFKNLAFSDIEQDTVILTAYKKPHLEKGLFFSEVSTVNELAEGNLKFDKHNGDQEAKWSNYILTEKELNFIKKISNKCPKIIDNCVSVAGIVTASNDFFIVTPKVVGEYNLEKYTKRIIRKGLYINGSAEVTNDDFDKLKSNDKPVFLLDLNTIKEHSFSKKLNNYLSLGVASNIPNRYKCKLRKRWFDVPSIWKSEGFFFKRGHNYPKILVNSAEAYVTDSAYRIKMHDGKSIESLVFSFYNSLTLLMAELNGRYYGGGVLELTPNEFKQLPIPFIQTTDEKFSKFLKNFENKNSIDEFLEIGDKNLLSAIDGITESDIIKINKLYLKVKSRRLRGK